MADSKMANQIKRKPISVSTPTRLDHVPAIATRGPVSTISRQSTRDNELVQSPSSITTREDSSCDLSVSDYYADEEREKFEHLQISSSIVSDSVLVTHEIHDSRPAPVPIQPLPGNGVEAGPTPTKSSKSLPLVAGEKIRSAYGEVRHFAGGLITHPHESTKHYSILRHSLGLVYYSGSYTNLAITIFADRELPSDRSFWLQRKGWSGKTGMRAGVLFGTHGAWLDVTPSVSATPDQVKPADERAWQRDIKKFLRKAPKKLAKHEVRETNVLRIPCEADDGYLRVVMCAGDKGKKFLCSSPIFRLASTSMSSSSIRGSSLKTLPIEVALKAGSYAAQQTANTFVGPYVETARTFVTGQITSVYQPSALVQTTMTTAYDHSGVPERIDNMNEQYDTARESSHQAIEHDTIDPLAEAVIIGDADGPQNPFPIRFNGKVVAGAGQSMATTGLPTANIVNVDSDILLRHSGIHFGWAAVTVPKKLREELLVDNDWHEAIISIVPDLDKKANVVQKKMIRIYIIEDFEGAKFFDAKINVIMMGFIRPAPQLSLNQDVDIERQVSEIYRDIASTTASLARPAWKADETLERIQSAASSRSFTERYVDARQSTQKQIDKVPAWRLGVRSDGAVLKDRFVGTGGITIPR